MINRMEDTRAAGRGGEGDRAGIVVTDGDLAILRFIHDYRLLCIEQVASLSGRTYTRVHRRLKGLFDAGFLRRIERPQRKDIYHLGRRGLAMLLSHGLISEAEAERRGREHELRPATLDHEMMIADVHVRLEIATRPGPIQLVAWREGDAIRDSFDVGSPPRKVVIQPDAFFQLKDTRLPDGQNRRTFFLEADRSTMGTRPRLGSQRFRDKVERYRWFIDTGRPFETYGVRSIRVLTLTLTRERRDNLVADTDAFLVESGLVRLRKFFLFGSLKDVNLAEPGIILNPIFRRPGESMSYPLFPALAELRASA
jgi:hypothetical protein